MNKHNACARGIFIIIAFVPSSVLCKAGFLIAKSFYTDASFSLFLLCARLMNMFREHSWINTTNVFVLRKIYKFISFTLYFKVTYV